MKFSGKIQMENTSRGIFNFRKFFLVLPFLVPDKNNCQIETSGTVKNSTTKHSGKTDLCMNMCLNCVCLICRNFRSLQKVVKKYLLSLL